jgi:hypothetical protein
MVYSVNYFLGPVIFGMRPNYEILHLWKGDLYFGLS